MPQCGFLHSVWRIFGVLLYLGVFAPFRIGRPLKMACLDRNQSAGTICAYLCTALMYGLLPPGFYLTMRVHVRKGSTAVVLCYRIMFHSVSFSDAFRMVRPMLQYVKVRAKLEIITDTS